jgi:hypothetical protein
MAPGLSLAGVQLSSRPSPRHRVSRVAFSPRCVRAIATTPVEPLGALLALLPQRWQLSLRNRQVSLHIACFEACSAFTRVTARTLAESLTDPFHRRLRTDRCLPARCDCYRLERSLAGRGFHPLRNCAFTRHTNTPAAIPPYDYPFTAPAVSPATMCLCASRNIAIAGRMVRVMKARTSCQNVMYSP